MILYISIIISPYSYLIDLVNERVSMSDKDIFNNNAPTNNDNSGENNPSSNNPSVDLLKGIINKDGKPKYDSVEKALEALKYSQEHIERLEREQRERDSELERLRTERAKSESVEEVVSRMLAANKEPARDPVQETPQRVEVDRDAVSKLVRETLEATRAKEISQQNFIEVQNSLISKFGDKTKEVVALKAAELGMSSESLGNLASQSPKMVLALFNAAPASKAGPSTTSVNLPLNSHNEPERPKLEKSILQGATTKDQMNAFSRSREYTNKRLGITN